MLIFDTFAATKIIFNVENKNKFVKRLIYVAEIFRMRNERSS
jgi:ATP phosphoribosyltransferase regulatory subunit HisZ